MAKQTINIGSAGGAGDGDTIRAGGDKINDNFNELYNIKPTETWDSVDLTNAATDIDCTSTNAFLVDPATAPDATERVLDFTNFTTQDFIRVKVRGHASRTVSLDSSIDGDSLTIPTDNTKAALVVIIGEGTDKHASIHSSEVTW